MNLKFFIIPIIDYFPIGKFVQLSEVFLNLSIFENRLQIRVLRIRIDHSNGTDFFQNDFLFISLVKLYISV